MRRPSFQFYPADWLGNTNLRRCSHAEKGLWIDILCLMHDSEDYGVLRWPLKDIASAISCKERDLQALIAKGVLKGGDRQIREPFIYVPRSGRRDGPPVILIAAQDGPLWYSSRMVRDEYVRKQRGQASRFGDESSGAPMGASMDSPKPPFGDGSSSSSSSSSSKREADEPPTPSRTAKATTFTAWLKTLRESGEKAITDHRPTWDYAQRVGLPDDFVELAWVQFRRRYSEDPTYTAKRYRDWRQVFRNALEGNWFRLWSAADDGYRLTTVGLQAQREIEALEVAA